MGWDSGFSKINKYENIDIETFYNIKRYLEWKNNPWNFEERTATDGSTIPAPYPTYEKYWSSCVEVLGDKKFPGIPDLDLVEKIESNEKTENYGFPYYETDIVSWGTWDSQRILDGFMCSNLEEVEGLDGMVYGPVTKEFILNALMWVEEELSDNKLIESSVKYCFKDNDDGTISLIPCDGIVAINVETGEERRVYSAFDEEEGCGNVYVPSSDYDDDKIWYLNSFKDALIKMSSMDPDANLIWYWRSY